MFLLSSQPWKPKQQGCHYGFARDENPLSKTYALDCTRQTYTAPPRYLIFPLKRQFQAGLAPPASLCSKIQNMGLGGAPGKFLSDTLECYLQETKITTKLCFYA